MLIKLFKIVLPIILIFCIAGSTEDVRAISNRDLNFRVFDTYSARISSREKEILDASLPNAYFNDRDYMCVSVAPMIDDTTGRIIGVPIYTQFFHGPEIETLCSDLLMEQFMQRNGIQDVMNIKIFSIFDFIDGFIARIETKHGIYFAVFMSGYDEYDALSKQRVFTAAEFYEFCMPSEVKLLVNDIEISCAQPPRMRFGGTIIPLITVLEALGFDVRWDNGKTIIFEKNGDVYEYCYGLDSPGDSIDSPGYGMIYKNGKMWRDARPVPDDPVVQTIVNGVLMVPSDFSIPGVYDICDIFSHTVNIKTIDPDAPPLFGLSSWAEAEGNSLNARGVIPSALHNDGFSYLNQENFQSPIRRDEFTALIVNVYELVKGEVSTYHSPFSDIADSDYKTEIEKAKTVGLIDGTSATGFTPSGLITREQAAKILCNLVSKIEETDPKPKGSPNYLDSAMISDWAAGFVAYAQENKIMTGSSTGRFYPLNNLSREEAMLVAERLIVQYGWDD